jgi:FkbM family methyltransferase
MKRSRVKLHMLGFLARMAALLNRVGLHRLNILGARVLKRLPGSNVVVDVGGVRLMASFDNWPILRKIRAATFEPFTLELFRDRIEAGMTVVDVGANIGFYTVIAAKLVGEQGRAYAFEPDPRSCADLNRNLKENNVHAVLFPKAASDRSGEQAFYLRRPASHSGLHDSGEEYLKETTVQCVRLDDVIGESIDVLKIDVEGGELSVLRGSRDLLHRSGEVTAFVECWPLALESAGVSVNEFLGELSSYFDEILAIDETRHQLVPMQPEGISRRCNLYCVRGSA